MTINIPDGNLECPTEHKHLEQQEVHNAKATGLIKKAQEKINDALFLLNVGIHNGILDSEHSDVSVGISLLKTANHRLNDEICRIESKEAREASLEKMKSDKTK